MANRFLSSFGHQQNGPFASQQDMMEQFNACKSDPVKFLADKGINVPPEYANNPAQIAQYLMTNQPQFQQNKILQTAGMIRNILGFR